MRASARGVMAQAVDCCRRSGCRGHSVTGAGAGAASGAAEIVRCCCCCLFSALRFLAVPRSLGSSAGVVAPASCVGADAVDAVGRAMPPSTIPPRMTIGVSETARASPGAVFPVALPPGCPNAMNDGAGPSVSPGSASMDGDIPVADDIVTMDPACDGAAAPSVTIEGRRSSASESSMTMDEANPLTGLIALSAAKAASILIVCLSAPHSSQTCSRVAIDGDLAPILAFYRLTKWWRRIAPSPGAR